MSNWPLPNSQIRHFLRELPKGSTGHPLGPLWQAFDPVKTDKRLKAKCIFCNSANAKPISGTGDLENVLLQIGIEKINVIVTDGVANYIRMKIILAQNPQAIEYIRAHTCNNTFRFSLPTPTRWNSFFVSLQQVQNKKQYLKITVK
ncbi:4422_t:CDS:2 [Cetraspora pellucida]|uniref:4422_t:CDS:1 n=1 Tax=Cetraspora pellucida TaxID=1433469 RepID=A0A9N9N3X5_9GLOM|nr:4422_t:CDS:2 [Cetraspora pellucida]